VNTEITDVVLHHLGQS